LGSAAWANWAREFSRVLPPGEFPIFDIPISHPIMHMVYDVDAFLQVSNISFWYQTAGSVSPVFPARLRHRRQRRRLCADTLGGTAHESGFAPEIVSPPPVDA